MILCRLCWSPAPDLVLGRTLSRRPTPSPSAFNLFGNFTRFGRSGNPCCLISLLLSVFYFVPPGIPVTATSSTILPPFAFLILILPLFIILL